MKQRWIRHDAAAIVVHRDGVTVVGPDGAGRRFTDASAELVRVALDFWSEPHAEDDLVEHLRALAGGCDPALVAETRTCLLAAGAIRAFDHDTPAHAPAPRPARARVLVGVSGAIAAMDAPALVRALLARRFEVAVAMTAAARRFTTAETLEALTHRPVARGFWRGGAHQPAPHVRLATWADLMVVHPASATTIARIAHGTCADVLSAAATAMTRPVLVVPSMNEAMLRSGAVQRNLELLRQDGRHLLLPRAGLEAAVAPWARTPIAGAAAGVAQVVAAIELLLEDVIRARAAAAATIETWDRHYERAALAELPWYTEQLDADLGAELAALPRGRLVDIGTGPGTTAIFAAQQGFDVVATDVAAAAIAAARRRASGLPVAWVLDDIVDSRLWGRFDVAVDRGCLHCLPRSDWPRYAESARRIVAPGGTLLVKVHAPGEGGDHGTTPASADDLAHLFGEHFSLVSARASSFDGTVRPAPKAVLAVLRRNGATR